MWSLCIMAWMTTGLGVCWFLVRKGNYFRSTCHLGNSLGCSKDYTIADGLLVLPNDIPGMLHLTAAILDFCHLHTRSPTNLHLHRFSQSNTFTAWLQLISKKANDKWHKCIATGLWQCAVTIKYDTHSHTRARANPGSHGQKAFKRLCTQLLNNLPLIIHDTSLLVISGTNLSLIHIWRCRRRG